MKNRQILKSDLEDIVDQAYSRFINNNGGANANYIPYLDEVDSSLFGIAITLPDGSTIKKGACDYLFGIESISKVFNIILVLSQYEKDQLVGKVGTNATGMPYNSTLTILMEREEPDTPLVNTGAISTVSLVKPIGDSDGKWECMVENMERMCGSKIELIDELYQSESATNYSNRAISWLLKNHNRLYDDTDMSLDLYTKGCSLGVTAEQLSIAGATIAFSGKNPVTGDQVFSSEFMTGIISMMATSGFYENTGRWMFNSGIPAKSGVGGGIMGVVPGAFGIAAFAPPLDMSGNSVRAQEAIKYIANSLDINVYNGQSIEII